MSGRPATPALQRLLRELPQRVDVERIDRIWLFPPREVAGRESGLVVLSLLPDPGTGPAQRRVVTVRYEAERVRGAIRLESTLAEQGIAPADRIPRLIEGVLARLGDPGELPVDEPVGGSAARWAAILASFGVPAVDPGNGE